MGYYIRAFCKSNKVPTIKELESSLKKDHPQIRIETKDKRDISEWRDFEYFYKKNKKPIFVELNLKKGPDSLAEEECKEFIDTVGNPGFSFSKRKVLKHLENTRYIVCCQLPTSDIDNDGYHLNGELLNYFVDNFEGMIQADGEGFYGGRKIIVSEK